MVEPNYYTTKWFSENLLAIEMSKTEVEMNKSVYLGLLILKLTKIAMCEYYHYYHIRILQFRLLEPVFLSKT